MKPVFSAISAFVLVGACGWSPRTYAGDCNGNGIEDRADVAGILNFAAPSCIATSHGQRESILVDVDNDGDLDLVLASSNDKALYVYENLGKGLFDAPVQYPTPTGPIELEAGDLDDDGDIDLVLSIALDDESNGFLVFENVGGGRFARREQYIVPDSFPPIALVDLNNDGALDVVIETLNGVAVLNGLGDHTFGPPNFLDFGPSTIYLRDVNGDGWLDFVLRQGYMPAFVLQSLNNGDGTFTTPSQILALSEPLTISVVDLDGDGDFDLTGINNPDKTLYVFKKTGTGYSAPTPYPTQGGPTAIDFADLDGDGDLDIAVATITPSNEPRVEVFINTGTASFVAAPSFPLPSTDSAGDILARDIDGDGDVDLFVPNPSANMIRVYKNNGHAEFTTADAIPPISVGADPADIVTGDLDGDGLLDVVVSNSGSSSVSVILGISDSAQATRTDYATNGDPMGLALEDLNNDGHPDLVVAQKSANSVGVMFNDGAGGLLPPVDYPVIYAPHFVALADLDGDHQLDIAAANNLFVSLLFNNGDGTFRRQADLRTASFTCSVAAVDLNGDGLIDIAAPAIYADEVEVFFNQGDGVFSSPMDVPTAEYPEAILAADIDDDGDLDLITECHGDGAINPVLSVILNEGEGSFQPHVDYLCANPYALRLVAADFNRDGILDIAQAGSSVGNIAVLLGLGGGRFAWRNEFAVAMFPSALQAVDFDQDSRPDLLVGDKTTDALRVVLNLSTPPVEDFNKDEIPDGCQCLGDFNHNRQIDLSDLGVVLAGYGCVGSHCQGDLNRDGRTDLSDLGHLLSAYGTTCP